MPCYHPLSAWKCGFVGGSKEIIFNESKTCLYDFVESLKLPCGQCIGCRLERSRQWAVRCVHEASLHSQNSFITLTYNDFHLPSDGSLHVEHFQKFMKRLRKHFGVGSVRFYHCGEYGSKTFRPHYHACLFGLDFKDKVLWKISNGVKLYTSEVLQKLWPCGFSTVGDVTFESAAYVARYIMKKITGKQALEHYRREGIDGNFYFLKPEYTTMSRRPGIAKVWFDKFKDDVYPKDFLTLNGKKLKPPRFYDNLYQREEPELFEDIKHSRYLRSKVSVLDNTRERLAVKEKVKERCLSMLVRKLD